jgi:hypothetical protein
MAQQTSPTFCLPVQMAEAYDMRPTGLQEIR